MEEERIESKILREYRTVAVVGISTNPQRPSYQVASYLMANGYNVIPVNPEAERILNRTSYPDLTSVPMPVEIVDIFRSPEQVGPIVEEAIKVKAKVVWMQEGVINEQAAAAARAAGLSVVMNKCMGKEHARLSLRHMITA